NLLSVKRGLSPRGHAGFLGQPDQQAQGLVSNPVLRIVEIQTGRLGDIAGTAAWVIGEQGTQMKMLRLLIMLRERPPGSGLGQGRGWASHICSPQNLRLAPPARGCASDPAYPAAAQRSATI